jgi:hypothetical protein
MRKLEDIPKKSVFKVPDGYFDQLPVKVQARISERNHTAASPLMSFSLKYALPVVALVVAGIFWFRSGDRESLESQLDSIDSEQIALYLANTDREDIDEVHDPGDWTSIELEELEKEVYSNMEYTDDELLEELDLDNL